MPASSRAASAAAVRGYSSGHSANSSATASQAARLVPVQGSPRTTTSRLSATGGASITRSRSSCALRTYRGKGPPPVTGCTPSSSGVHCPTRRASSVMTPLSAVTQKPVTQFSR